jgi:hypothetical protein
MRGRAQGECLPGPVFPLAPEKKGPDVAVRAWKFWERMPERPDSFAATAHISQVRKDHSVLHIVQLRLIPHHYILLFSVLDAIDNWSLAELCCDAA